MKNPAGSHNFKGRLAGANRFYNLFHGRIPAALAKSSFAPKAAPASRVSRQAALTRTSFPAAPRIFALPQDPGKAVGAFRREGSNSMGAMSPKAASDIRSGRGGLFDTGGFTGVGPKHMPAGLVHAGEFVFSKEAVDRIGIGNLDALHDRLKGFAGGGFVGDMTAGDMPEMAGPSIVINNNNGSKVAATPRQGPGGLQLNVSIDDVLADLAGRRGTKMNQVLERGYGMTPRIKRVY